MTSDDIFRVRTLLANDDEDHLFETIGKYNPDTIYALPQDRAQLIAAGREWFEKRGDEIRRHVCPKLKDISKATSDDFVTFVFTYLSLHNGKALAVFLTALVIKRTMKGWCSADPQWS